MAKHRAPAHDVESGSAPPYHFLVVAAVFAGAAVAFGGGEASHDAGAPERHGTAKPSDRGGAAAHGATRGPAQRSPEARRTLAPREPRREPSTAAAPDVQRAAAVEPAPAPLAAPAPGSEFDPVAARAALTEAGKQAAYCRRGADPGGVASVAVTFTPSGKIGGAAVVNPPLAGTITGNCVAGRMRGASVPAFTGKAVTLQHRVTVY